MHIFTKLCTQSVQLDSFYTSMLRLCATNCIIWINCMKWFACIRNSSEWLKITCQYIKWPYAQVFSDSRFGQIHRDDWYYAFANRRQGNTIFYSENKSFLNAFSKCRNFTPRLNRAKRKVCFQNRYQAFFVNQMEKHHSRILFY